MSGRERIFAMFCTIGSGVFLFAEVAAAVGAFREHVRVHGEDHIPHIHMEPMRSEWRIGQLAGDGDARSFTLAESDAIRGTFGPNLFRQPENVAS